MSEQTLDLVLCKFGQNYDYIRIDSACGYAIDTIEPFLDLRVGSDNPIAKQKLTFTDDNGKVYEERISDILRGGLKLYYHDQPLNFDPDKYPGVRVTGLIQSLLDEIEIVVSINNLS